MNDDDPQIVYTGSWGRSTGRGLGDFEDDVHYTETNGDFFEYSFVGTGVDYVTETHSSQGDVDIYLDREFKKTVSTYLDPAQGVVRSRWSTASQTCPTAPTRSAASNAPAISCCSTS